MSQSPFRQKTSTSWEGWKLKTHKDGVLLSCKPKGYSHPHEIELADCRLSAEVLDWIAQIAAKPWATDRASAGVVRAFDDVLLLQQNYCSMGQEQSPDDATIHKAIMEAVARADTAADGTPPRQANHRPATRLVS